MQLSNTTAEESKPPNPPGNKAITLIPYCLCFLIKTIAFSKNYSFSCISPVMPYSNPIVSLFHFFPMPSLQPQRLTPAEQRLFLRFRSAYQQKEQTVQRTTRVLEERLKKLREQKR